MSTKGQSISYDFLSAIVIFLLTAGVVFLLLESSISNIQDYKRIKEISETSSRLSETLMMEGVPKNWDPESVVEIGLLSGGKLNQTKLYYLEDLGYSNVKRMAGIGEYNFFINVLDMENQTLFEFGDFPQNPEFISKTRRISILENKIVFLDVVVWG